MKTLHELAAHQKVALINLIRGAHSNAVLDAETIDAAVFALNDADRPGNILPTTPPPPPPPDAWAQLTDEQQRSIGVLLTEGLHAGRLSATEHAAAFARLGLVR